MSYSSEIECNTNYFTQQKTKVDYFSFLPPEILVQIFKHLNNKELHNIKKVCKYIKNIINTHLRVNYTIKKPEIKFEVTYDKGDIYITLHRLTYKTRKKFKNFIKQCNVTRFYDKRRNNISTEKLITNEVIEQWPNLEYLELTNGDTKQYKIVTENGLRKLVNLKYLKIRGKYKFTKKSLSNLTNLEELDLRLHSDIRDIDILTGLKKLSLLEVDTAPSRDKIKKLTNLRSLTLQYAYLIKNNYIKGEDILNFKHLTELNIRMVYTSTISVPTLNKIFQTLTNLTKLELSYPTYRNSNYFHVDMSGLIKLTELKLIGISGTGIKILLPLANLERLIFDFWELVNLDELLTNLTKLTHVELVSDVRYHKPKIDAITLKKLNFIMETPLRKFGTTTYLLRKNN